MGNIVDFTIFYVCCCLIFLFLSGKRYSAGFFNSPYHQTHHRPHTPSGVEEVDPHGDMASEHTPTMTKLGRLKIEGEVMMVIISMDISSIFLVENIEGIF